MAQDDWAYEKALDFVRRSGGMGFITVGGIAEFIRAERKNRDARAKRVVRSVQPDPDDGQAVIAGFNQAKTEIVALLKAQRR